jgi:hypothetical protein
LLSTQGKLTTILKLLNSDEDDGGNKTDFSEKSMTGLEKFHIVIGMMSVFFTYHY